MPLFCTLDADVCARSAKFLSCERIFRRNPIIALTWFWDAIILQKSVRDPTFPTQNCTEKKSEPPTPSSPLGLCNLQNLEQNSEQTSGRNSFEIEKLVGDHSACSWLQRCFCAE